MITSNGSNDFDQVIKDAGGLKNLAKEPYMRNIWRVMHDFGKLMSDPDLQNLTPTQLDMKMFSYDVDAKEEERRRQLRNGGEIFEDDDEKLASEMSEEEWDKYLNEFATEKQEKQLAELGDDEDMDQVFGDEDNFSELVDRESKEMDDKENSVESFQEDQFEKMVRLGQELQERQARGENISFDDLYKEEAEKEKAQEEADVEFPDI